MQPAIRSKPLQCILQPRRVAGLRDRMLQEHAAETHPRWRRQWYPYLLWRNHRRRPPKRVCVGEAHDFAYLLPDDGAKLLQAAERQGLEGIVSKRQASAYSLGAVPRLGQDQDDGLARGEPRAVADV
jgi:hypothetical protein